VWDEPDVRSFLKWLEVRFTSGRYFFAPKSTPLLRICSAGGDFARHRGLRAKPINAFKVHTNISTYVLERAGVS
jgi:hypothetical protein